MASDGLQLDFDDQHRGLLRAHDLMPFMVSMLFHLGLLVVLALVPVLFTSNPISLTVLAPEPEEFPQPVLLPEEFHVGELPTVELGAASVGGSEAAFSAAVALGEISEVASPSLPPVIEISPLSASRVVDIPAALHVQNLAVRGTVGVGTRGASGAIDRIAQEILLSLEERPTLVVWLFDQSASLQRQRKAIHDQLERVYRELGVLEASGIEAFSKHTVAPLLSAVGAFGSKFDILTERPTAQVSEIKEAIASISLDDTGVERVFTAVYGAAKRYQSYRRRSPARNVMLIVFTDEAGEDQMDVDRTVNLCRRVAIPVYVVGVPAPFGRRETLIKWVDPDPRFDQAPQRGVVDQGPESLLPERIQLTFFGGGDPGLIDSGFGPFALTRLCYETGGIYFTVHPNRIMKRRVAWHETTPYTAHLNHFFDPEVMRKYRPDYVSTEEYIRRLKENLARSTLIRAAQMSWTVQMQRPQLRFVKRSEAGLVNALSEAQKDAATIEPKLKVLLETLRAGEVDRSREASWRWQAGYDLAMGRVLAAKVRTEGYNSMLAKAKRGMDFKNSRNNTWVLAPSKEVLAGSRLVRESEAAREYLNRVRAEHPDTPWSLLAARELATPLGWRWKERYTEMAPPRSAVARNNNRPRAPRDDRRRAPRTPPPKRPPPKL